MTAPAVSVALCTYNGARFLPGQLASLLAQDAAGVEIVAVDDASTDGTVAILEEHARRHPAFRVVVNEARLGLNGNFARAFGLCRAPLIAPCDQDDRWHPAKLSTLAAGIGGHALAYCDSALIDEGGAPLGQRVSARFAMYAGSDPRVFTFQNCVSGHAALFRRELLAQLLPLPDGVYYDWWLAFCAAAHGGIAYVDRCLVEFRQHAAAASRFTRAGAPRARPGAWQRFQAESRSLAALRERAPAPWAPFYAQLWELWRRRADAPLNPALAAFLMRHGRALYALRRGPPALKWRHALKHLWGVRRPAGEAA